MIVEKAPAKGDSAESGLPRQVCRGGVQLAGVPCVPPPPDLYKIAELWGQGRLVCCVQGTAQRAMAFAPVSRAHEPQDPGRPGLQDPGSGRRLELLSLSYAVSEGFAQDPNPDLSDLEVGAVLQ